MDDDALFELIGQASIAYGSALPRDSNLLREIDDPNYWLELADEIGEQRARDLFDGLVVPTQSQREMVIRWQISHSFAKGDPDVTPVIWFCPPDPDGVVIVIEGWGGYVSADIFLKLIGRYPSEEQAIAAIKRLYICGMDEL